MTRPGVLINANARGVRRDPGLAERLRRLVPGDCVRATRSADEIVPAIAALMERAIDALVLVGGDGTLPHTLTPLLLALRRGRAARDRPHARRHREHDRPLARRARQRRSARSRRCSRRDLREHRRAVLRASRRRRRAAVRLPVRERRGRALPRALLPECARPARSALGGEPDQRVCARGRSARAPHVRAVLGRARGRGRAASTRDTSR